MESIEDAQLWDFESIYTNQEEQEEQQQQQQQQERYESTQEIIDMLFNIKQDDEEAEEEIVVDGSRARTDLEDFMALDESDMNNNLQECDADQMPLMPQFEDTPKGRNSQLVLNCKLFNSQSLIGEDLNMVNTPEVMRDIIELQQRFPGTVSGRISHLIEDIY